MSKLQGLRSRLRGRIHTTRVLLTEMSAPVQSSSQEIAYEGHIKRIRNLTLEADTDILGIAADHEGDINATELENFKASLQDIERETSTAYKDHCTWKGSITRPQSRTHHSPNTTSSNADVQDRQAHRLVQATETAKAAYINIKADSDIMKQEVTQHGNYLTAEDHIITEGMKSRKP